MFQYHKEYLEGIHDTDLTMMEEDLQEFIKQIEEDPEYQDIDKLGIVLNSKGLDIVTPLRVVLKKIQETKKSILTILEKVWEDSIK